MKTHILVNWSALLVLSTFIACETGDTDSTPEPELYTAEIVCQEQTSFAEEMSDIHLIIPTLLFDDGFGYAVAKSGQIYSYSPTESWLPAGQVPREFTSHEWVIHTIDAQNLLVSSLRPNEFILKSADGGHSWKEVYRVADEDKNLNFTPSDFFFVNAQVGFSYSAYVGIGTGPESYHDHFILKTDDAGETWRKIEMHPFTDAPSTTRVGIWHMGMQDPGNLIATGTHFLHSTDLGETWKVVPGAPQMTYGVAFLPSGKTIAGGSTGQGFLMHTENGILGEWSHYLYDDGVLPPRVPNSVQYDQPNIQKLRGWQQHLIAIGTNSTWVSMDGGHTWERPVAFEPFALTLAPPYDKSYVFSAKDGVGYYLSEKENGTTAFCQFEIKPL